jgi:Patatin-like phospholipase
MSKRWWFSSNVADQNRFSPDDYLYRLAQEIIGFSQTDNRSEEASQDEFGHLYMQLGNPKVTVQLATKLENMPALQQRLSFLVNYTPSRWLVEQEIDEIKRLRDHRKQRHDDHPNPKLNPYRWMHDSKVTGLCFSGGGIRSATFNLGILQGLAQCNLLHRFDYLSTVSGGGYIHEWLAGWIKRSRGLDNIKEQLKPLPEEGCPPFHPAPLRWLRRYSNYLTPETGLFSADSWVVAAIWIRNTFLNQLVLVSALLMLVLFPHVLGPGTHSLHLSSTFPCASIGSSGSGNCDWLPNWTSRLSTYLQNLSTPPPSAGTVGVAVHSTWSRSKHLPWLFSTAAILSFAFGVTIMALSLRAARLYGEAECDDDRKRLWPGGGQIESQAIVLMFLLAALFTSRLLLLTDSLPHCDSTIYRVVYLLIFTANIIVALCGGARRAFEILSGFDAARASVVGRTSMWLSSFGGLVLFFSAIASLAATALFAFLHFLICYVLPDWLSKLDDQHPWKVALVFGPPLLLWVPFFSQVLLAGLIGRDFADWLREWLARVRAWSFMIGLIWFGWFGIALFAGPLLDTCWASFGAIKWPAIGAWVFSTIAAVLSGKSDKSTGTPRDTDVRSRTLNAIAIVGPYVFIFGLMILLAWVGDHALRYASTTVLKVTVCLLPAAVFALFGRRVDINEFSMHAFYRNRLTRCYLGATNTERRPNPLTGLDECDTRGMELSTFRPPEKSERGYDGPFPIICSTLNLTFGEDLAWQERKAASFAFTPLYSGYHVGWTSGGKGAKLSYNGYVPTQSYAYPHGGINLATAVAISGAAVSPNWGYHTNPATAFLLTMFNVRLGWWLRNPRRSQYAGRGNPGTHPYDSRENPSPKWPVFQLGGELLGRVDDSSDFVYLTDGGHFENMGLYELVRRHCRTIVVCDAEEDHDYKFEGIGKAIQLCRIDFGVEIDLNLLPLRPQLDATLGYPVSKQHFVVGTIRYPERWGAEAAIEGKILYIKSSLTGQSPEFIRHPVGGVQQALTLPGEPGDIVHHRLGHDSFPNDSTLDQWFDETTFESYRRLGIHVAAEIQECGVWSDVL